MTEGEAAARRSRGRPLVCPGRRLWAPHKVAALEALMPSVRPLHASQGPAVALEALALEALAPGETAHDAFAARHIGPGPAEVEQWLAVTGLAALDELTEAALPREIGHDARLSLPAPLTEPEALAELRRLAAQNEVLTSMIGLGYYGTVTPAVIRRNLFENPAWYTAYTPYQPEISQGRLEALLNFQTMVSDLTGLPVAGASLLDEATAAAEAMTLARRAATPAAGATTAGSVFLADADCLPQTLAVLRTPAQPL